MYVQAPKQSPILSFYLYISQTRNELKMVTVVAKSIKTPTPVKKQKDCKLWKLDVHPRKKAMALVKDVMVIDDPACIIASPILSSIDFLGSV